MSPLEDLLQAAIAATKDRQQDALDVLRGRAKAIDPTAINPLEPPPERYLTLKET
jgi:hypothetical protein